MKLTSKIFSFVLVLVTIALTFMSGVLIYYKTIGKDKLPTAVTSTYATTVIDPQTGEEKPTIEANYYANKNGSGYEVIELLFNCYSGIGKQAIYSRGFQLVYDKDGHVIPYTYEVEHTTQTSEIYQYDKYNDAAFETGHNYSWGDPMIIDIDGKTYAVKLDGKYTVTTTYADGWKIGRTVGFLGLNLLWEGTDFSKTEVKTYNYTFKDLLVKVGQIIKSLNNGTGDSVISLIDLGDFLHIYNVDDNGQIAGEPLGVNTLQNSYFTMATHYDNRGMVWAKQSMFGSVAGDSQFNISGISDNVDYWKAETQYKLTEKDFTARYVTSDNGYYYVLSTDKLNEIKNFENIEIDVDFNVSNFENVNVLGFDYYALYGIKVKTLTIRSDNQREFKLLVGSLKETGLTSETVIAQNITINNINSGVVL